MSPAAFIEAASGWALSPGFRRNREGHGLGTGGGSTSGRNDDDRRTGRLGPVAGAPAQSRATAAGRFRGRHREAVPA